MTENVTGFEAIDRTKDLKAGELLKVEQTVGYRMDKWKDANGLELLVAMVWILRKRDEPDLTFDQVADTMTPAELNDFMGMSGGEDVDEAEVREAAVVTDPSQLSPTSPTPTPLP